MNQLTRIRSNPYICIYIYIYIYIYKRKKERKKRQSDSIYQPLKIDKVGLNFVSFCELVAWLHTPTFGGKIKVTQSLNGVIYNLEWRIKYHSLGINFNTLTFHTTNLRRIWHLSICSNQRRWQTVHALSVWVRWSSWSDPWVILHRHVHLWGENGQMPLSKFFLAFCSIF